MGERAYLHLNYHIHISYKIEKNNPPKLAIMHTLTKPRETQQVTSTTDKKKYKKDELFENFELTIKELMLLGKKNYILMARIDPPPQKDAEFSI